MTKIDSSDVLNRRADLTTMGTYTVTVDGGDSTLTGSQESNSTSTEVSVLTIAGDGTKPRQDLFRRNVLVETESRKAHSRLEASTSGSESCVALEKTRRSYASRSQKREESTYSGGHDVHAHGDDNIADASIGNGKYDSTFQRRNVDTNKETLVASTSFNGTLHYKLDTVESTSRVSIGTEEETGSYSGKALSSGGGTSMQGKFEKKSDTLGNKTEEGKQFNADFSIDSATCAQTAYFSPETYGISLTTTSIKDEAKGSFDDNGSRYKSTRTEKSNRDSAYTETGGYRDNFEGDQTTQVETFDSQTGTRKVTRNGSSYSHSPGLNIQPSRIADPPSIWDQITGAVSVFADNSVQYFTATVSAFSDLPEYFDGIEEDFLDWAFGGRGQKAHLFSYTSPEWLTSGIRAIAGDDYLVNTGGGRIALDLLVSAEVIGISLFTGGAATIGRGLLGTVATGAKYGALDTFLWQAYDVGASAAFGTQPQPFDLGKLARNTAIGGLTGGLFHLARGAVGLAGRFVSPKVVRTAAEVAPNRGLAGNPMFRHALQPYKGGAASNAGRALTKHPNIVGVNIHPNQVMKALIDKFGSQAGVNQAAADALKNIMRNGIRSAKSTKAFGDVIDFKLPSGHGARFDATTNEFLHFLGRGL